MLFCPFFILQKICFFLVAATTRAGQWKCAGGIPLVGVLCVHVCACEKNHSNLSNLSCLGLHQNFIYKTHLVPAALEMSVVMLLPPSFLRGLTLRGIDTSSWLPHHQYKLVSLTWKTWVSSSLIQEAFSKLIPFPWKLGESIFEGRDLSRERQNQLWFSR